MAAEVPEPTASATAPVDEETAKSATSKLKELMDAANLQYGLKNYAEAADLYSSATELQAELNGEMAPENADLLYRYGRCLYQVAVAKSDVLGGQVAGEKKKNKANGATKTNGAAGSGSSAAAAESLPSGEEIIEVAVEQKNASEPPAQEKTVENQPYFQITGMENWDSDEEEEEGDEGEAQGEDAEEDDFATAYEVLDLARVLLQRQLEALQSDQANGIESKGKGVAVEDEDSPARQIKLRLADTYDLQAEISLENERFSDAIPDFRASLALKQDLHTKESSIIAEAHYKLSLALEFASVDKIREAQTQEGQQTVQVKKEDIDEVMRKEAAVEMEAAIESCRLRITKEEEALKGLEAEAAEKKKMSIKEVKEIVEDMESRVSAISQGVAEVANNVSLMTFATPTPLYGLMILLPRPKQCHSLAFLLRPWARPLRSKR
jgi:HAT1-interacting factor 1